MSEDRVSDVLDEANFENHVAGSRERYALEVYDMYDDAKLKIHQVVDALLEEAIKRGQRIEDFFVELRFQDMVDEDLDEMKHSKYSAELIEYEGELTLEEATLRIEVFQGNDRTSDNVEELKELDV